VSANVRVELPANLVRLAGCGHVLELSVAIPVTQRTVLDALEARYPMLAGCVRDHATGLRRPFLRFFACEQDLSHLRPDDPLPNPVADGRELFLIVGAIAGG
jgi:sulfur-carrier protein